MSDVPSAVKMLCPDYQAVEARFTAAIYERFGLEPLDEAAKQFIKIADTISVEQEIYMPPKYSLSSASAQLLFLRRFKELTHES